MQLAKIVGTVVATRKDPKLEGMRLLVVSPLDIKGKEKSDFLIAVDSVGAGLGEVVLLVAGSSARQTEATTNKPVDATIMAIVDSFDVHQETVYQK